MSEDWHSNRDFDEIMVKHRLSELMRPCRHCGEPAEKHDNCPCLVIGCIGKIMHERCNRHRRVGYIDMY